MKDCEILFELLDELGIKEKNARGIIIEKIIWKLVAHVEKLDSQMQELQNRKKEKRYIGILEIDSRNKIRILEYMLKKLKNVINTEFSDDPELSLHVGNIEKAIGLLKI